jgi:hypothetical protein
VAPGDHVSDLLVAYRGTTDSLEIYKNGNLDSGETITGGLPTAPATMRIEYSLSDFNAGSTVAYNVFFDDSLTAFASGSFTWSGTNENYLSLSSNLSNDARFDNLEIRGGEAIVDEDPPNPPDPMSWAIPPAAAGEDRITMTATTANDPSGVEYFFTNTTVTGHDSGWQDSPVYLDSGLIPGTTYSYTVIARDKSPFQNTTTALAPAPASTLGEQPPYYAWSGGMAFLADGNTDGVANGMAWFLGAADPQAAVSALLPSIDNSDPDDFILSYLPDSSALTAGAEATVYYSTDLTNWTAALDGVNIIIDDSGDLVEIRFARDLASDGKFFVKLQVGVPESP